MHTEVGQIPKPGDETVPPHQSPPVQCRNTKIHSGEMSQLGQEARGKRVRRKGTMWRILLLVSCFAPPSLGQDEDGEGQFIEQAEVTFPLPVSLRGEEAIPSDLPEYPSRKVPSVSFPLERPDPDNIGSVCQHLGWRKTYPPGSLPTTGFGHLHRQADALRRMEESFTSCCLKTDPQARLECALGGWKESLDQFCEEEFSIKTRPHSCCRELEGDERHECFALAAPSLSYLPPADTSHGKSSTCLSEGTAPPEQENYLSQ